MDRENQALLWKAALVGVFPCTVNKMAIAVIAAHLASLSSEIRQTRQIDDLPIVKQESHFQEKRLLEYANVLKIVCSLQ